MAIKLFLTTSSADIILLSLLTFSSCKKDEGKPLIDVSFLLYKWKVISIAEQATMETTPDLYVFEFYDRTNFSVSLDVNGCSGHYNITEQGKITILDGGLACTKKCCDSSFGIKLSGIVPRMTAYVLDGSILTLSGNGKIVLQKLKL